MIIFFGKRNLKVLRRTKNEFVNTLVVYYQGPNFGPKLSVVGWIWSFFFVSYVLNHN